MPRRMDQAAVAKIRAEMDQAGTSPKARRKMAVTALKFTRELTACGRAEWEKEL